MRSGTSTLTMLLTAAMLTTSPAFVVAGDTASDPSPLSFEIGGDFATEYWFRGIGQENSGVIFQPYASITMNLWNDDDSDWSLDGYVSTWNSLHGDSGTGTWYERDLAGGFVLNTPGGHAIDVSYINLYNPATPATFAEEIDIALSINDTAWAEQLDIPALNPHVTVAFETSGGSDAGTNEGTYLELGIEPSFEICPDNPDVTLSIPVTFGFSLDDYYEDPTGDDDFFGYADVGLVLGFPLNLPEGFGHWDATAGVHALFLGSTAETISTAFGTGDEDFSVFATFGISTSF